MVIGRRAQRRAAGREACPTRLCGSGPTGATRDMTGNGTDGTKDERPVLAEAAHVDAALFGETPSAAV